MTGTQTGPLLPGILYMAVAGAVLSGPVRSGNNENRLPLCPCGGRESRRQGGPGAQVPAASLAPGHGSEWNRLFCCVTASSGCASWAPSEERQGTWMWTCLPLRRVLLGASSWPLLSRIWGLYLAPMWPRAHTSQGSKRGFTVIGLWLHVAGARG